MKRWIWIWSFLLTATCMYAASPHIAERVKYKNGPSFIYRLYISDKKNSPYSIHHPGRYLSRRSIERRKRQQLPIDSTDLPVSPRYLRLIEQQNVSIEGEVMYAGAYTLSKKNERLSDVFRKAGGATDLAFIEGARLERRVNEYERIRLEEIAKMRKEERERILQEMALNNNRSTSEMAQFNRIEEVTQIPDTYPVGIELDKALANPGCDEDIVLREGDRIIIPKYNGTVKINGEVMYPNSVAFNEGKKANYYIKQAGGFNRYAKKNQTYVIYMNGTVAKVTDGAKIRPGCEIVVPQKSMARKMTTAEYLAIGSTAASLATMVATIANLSK